MVISQPPPTAGGINVPPPPLLGGGGSVVQKPPPSMMPPHMTSLGGHQHQLAVPSTQALGTPIIGTINFYYGHCLNILLFFLKIFYVILFVKPYIIQCVFL